MVGLSRSTAPLAAPGSRVPEQNEQRQWRPLDQALDVLWQAGGWREELIPLLLLLAERADRRLHPLPWALPVPLRVHGHYTRAEIEAAYCFSARRLRPPQKPAARACSAPTPPGSTANWLDDRQLNRSGPFDASPCPPATERLRRRTAPRASTCSPTDSPRTPPCSSSVASPSASCPAVN